MSVLYNVGNVREQLKKLYSKDFSQFVWLYVEYNKIYLAKVNKIDDKKWQISNLVCGYKQDEDDKYFYQEELYKFCRSEFDLKYLVITFAQSIGKQRIYEFPQMPLNDVKKALFWELQEDEDLDKFNYVYEVNSSIDNLKIIVYLINKDIIDFWQGVAKEQGLVVMSIYKSHNDDINIKRVDEYNLEYEEKNLSCSLQIDRELIDEYPEFWELSKDLVKFLGQEYGELLNYKQIPSKWRWSKIFLLIITFLLSCSIAVSSFCYIKYQKAFWQENEMSEHLALIQKDLDTIEDLSTKEQNIAEKQKLIRDLEDKSINLYPILVNLGAVTVEDIALINVEMNSQGILLIGMAKDYDAIAKYNEQLTQLKFVHNTQINEIKLDEQNNLWKFTLSIK